jgi:hypothetical protein
MDEYFLIVYTIVSLYPLHCHRQMTLIIVSFAVQQVVQPEIVLIASSDH